MSSVAASSSVLANSRAVDWGRYVLVGPATIIAAVVANVVVYVIGGAFVAYDPEFPPLATGGGTIVFTVIPAIVAVLLYAALLRFAANPRRVFTIVAAGVLVLSWVPDLTYIPTVPGASAAQTAVLMLMHLVAAAVIVGLLTTQARPESRQRGAGRRS